MRPTGRPDETCRPNTASGAIGEHAFLDHLLAPQLPPVKGRIELGPSSEGWNMNFTVPAVWSFMAVRTSASHQDRRVGVIPQACITSTSRRVFSLSPWRRTASRPALHRQRIHVGAQRNHRPGLAALAGHDTGFWRRRSSPEAERLQFRRQGRRCVSPAPEFRMLVNVAAPRDQFVLDRGCALADFLSRSGTMDCARTGPQRP